MWISRIRVTGGFLHGLDITFNRGLNVVIGPRGAGKTAVLELLRHALGAEHPDQSAGAQRQRNQFLEAVLGAGEVIVDVESEDGGRHLVVDANGAGQRVDLSGSVVMLGQNELEGIASDPPSRLNLLDLRLGRSVVREESVERASAAEFTRQLFAVRAEIESRREEADKRTRLRADRDLLASQEALLMGRTGTDLVEQRELLRATEEVVIQTGRDHESVGNLLADVQVISSGATTTLQSLGGTSERAQEFFEDDIFERAREHAERLTSELNEVASRLVAFGSELHERNLQARTSAAPVREALEEAEAGLGQVTSQLRNIDVALRNLDENDARLDDLQTQFRSLSLERAAALDLADGLDELIYGERSEVAHSATAQVGDNVVVVVEHLADTESFKSFLQDALRGTSTRLASIDAVVERVLPRHLLEFIENHDAEGLASVTGLGEERAGKLVNNLDDPDVLADLARIRLADKVDFRLRDGSVDKSVDELSTGQKCSVTLPIVMSERERSLILDQPEDHLDNAFLVSNVVTALAARTRDGAQSIIATHNANIPVLGSAGTVVVLGSDGGNGVVEVRGPFDSDEVVDRVTKLMEGGREAFARRASFYAAHGGLD